jgi:hypothetical protein
MSFKYVERSAPKAGASCATVSIDDDQGYQQARLHVSRLDHNPDQGHRGKGNAGLKVAARVKSVYSSCGPAGMISSGTAAWARPAATLSSSIGLGMIGIAIVGRYRLRRPARPCQDRRKISTAHS